MNLIILPGGRILRVVVIVLSLILGSLSLSAQTDPAAYSLSGGSYAFSAWDSGSSAGTYPANMIFHRTAAQDPVLSEPTASDYTGVYNLTSGTRISGQGDNGFAFINTGTNGNLGAAVLALNTLGRSDVTVGWTGRTITTGSRTYAIRLQYRVAIDGTWTDVSPTSEYTSSGTAGHSSSFSGIALPVQCNNQALVELRWKYYYISGSSNRPQLGVDDIAVSSLAMGSDPVLTLVSPNGGETIVQNTVRTIAWSSANYDNPVKIELLGATETTTLAESTDNDGAFDWSVAATPVGSYTIRVSDATDGTPSDTSDAAFTVAEPGVALQPGDIAIIGIRCDANDGIAFVTWIDLTPMTTIAFTDNAWNGTSLATDENTAVWTAGAYIPAGTVIVGSFAAGAPVWSHGSASGDLDGISASGDNVFAYQGAAAAPSFLSGICDDGTGWLTEGTVTSNTSYLPAVLDAAGCNVALAEIDNSQYTGPRTSNTIAAHRERIADLSNWTGNDDGALFGALDGTAFVIGLPPAAITVIAPNGGEVWDLGSTQAITWSCTNYAGTVDIALVGDSTRIAVATGVDAATGTLDWYIDTALYNGGSWRIEVRAAGVDTPSDQSDSSFTLKAPPAMPANLVITASDTGIVLSWDPVDGATGYTVRRSGSPYDFSSAVGFTATGTTFTDTPDDGPCYYRVTATN